MKIHRDMIDYHGIISARSLGVVETTTRRYLDVLEGLFMVRRLNPWFANLKKRQVRSPRIYVRDSGLLHALLGIRSERDLLSHPKSGASWEGYVVEEVLSAFEPDEAYSWATHNGAELDLTWSGTAEGSAWSANGRTRRA